MMIEKTFVSLSRLDLPLAQLLLSLLTVIRDLIESVLSHLVSRPTSLKDLQCVFDQ